MVIDFPKGKLYCVGGVAFKSANDCPVRDPKEILIYYFPPESNEGDPWQQIASYTPQWAERRWETVKLNFKPIVT